MVKTGSFFRIPNKFWELQIDTWPGSTTVIEFAIRWTRGCDHAGFEFILGILRFEFRFQIYDARHWDRERNNWEQ